MRWLLAALLIVAALAGCVGDGPDDPDPPADADPVQPAWAARAVTDLSKDERHVHGDPTHHEGFTTPNFEILGFDPLVTDYHNRPAGGTYCGTVAETDDRRLAVYHSFTTDVAIMVIDLTDPADPELVGELVLPFTHVYDATVTDDGLFAVLATSPTDTGPDFPPGYVAGLSPTYTVRPMWRDACGNESYGPETNLPYASGIVLVDLTDPTAPAVADYEPQPILGAHSVSAATIDGTTYVAASTTNLVHATSYFVFYTLNTIPVAGLPSLVPYGTFTAQYPDAGAIEQDLLFQLNGHVDATVHKHPVTGQVVAYLANWNGGMVTIELAGAGNIQPLGYWQDYDASKGSEMTGQWHSVRPLDGLRDGRHITLFGQEIGGRPSLRPTSLALLMDTTDPANPTPLARWTLPVDVQWDGGAMWSTHYIDLVNDTLFVSLYHGGVWAADASEEHWPNLPSIGAFVPNAAPPDLPVALYADWDPLVMEVNHLNDGTLVILDGTSGVYTVRFTPDDPRVPPVAPWTEDNWVPE